MIIFLSSLVGVGNLFAGGLVAVYNRLFELTGKDFSFEFVD